MELQKIVVLCAVVVVLGAGGWFLLSGNQGETNPEANSGTAQNEMEQTEPINEEEADVLSGVGELTSLLRLGRSIMCTYAYSDETGEGKGTGYFDDNRMRVDATYTQDGKTFDSHAINDGENLYSWTTSSEGAFAIVTAVDESEAATFNDSMPAHDSRSMNTLDQQVSYDCDPWRVDESVFVPPSDIEFMDMNAMMQEVMGNMPEDLMENIPEFNQ